MGVVGCFVMVTDPPGGMETGRAKQTGRDPQIEIMLSF